MNTIEGVNFVALVIKVREAQKRYFSIARAGGSQQQKEKALQESKELEKELDDVLEKEKKGQYILF